MKQIEGNIFDIKDADAICVTTNTCLKANGLAVMGAGIAKAFAERYPSLQAFFGEDLRYRQGVVFVARVPGEERAIVNFPTKYLWRENSNLNLIIRSAEHLVAQADFNNWKKVVLTRPGCGNGGLDWKTQVEPAIKDILDDRFYIITPAKDQHDEGDFIPYDDNDPYGKRIQETSDPV